MVHSHWSRSVEAWLSLVESFIVLKYFHGVATPALLWHKDRGLSCTGRWLSYTERILCHKEPAKGTNTPEPWAGSLWHKSAGVATPRTWSSTPRHGVDQSDQNIKIYVFSPGKTWRIWTGENKTKIKSFVSFYPPLIQWDGRFLFFDVPTVKIAIRSFSEGTSQRTHEKDS